MRARGRHRAQPQRRVAPRLLLVSALVVGSFAYSVAAVESGTPSRLVAEPPTIAAPFQPEYAVGPGDDLTLDTSPLPAVEPSARQGRSPRPSRPVVLSRAQVRALSVTVGLAAVLTGAGFAHVLREGVPVQLFMIEPPPSAVVTTAPETSAESASPATAPARPSVAVFVPPAVPEPAPTPAEEPPAVTITPPAASPTSSPPPTSATSATKDPPVSTSAPETSAPSTSGGQGGGDGDDEPPPETTAAPPTPTPPPQTDSQRGNRGHIRAPGTATDAAAAIRAAIG